MTDEKIAPLMASTDNPEESENSDSSKNVDNDNELANLLRNNNIGENININNNIRNNFHLNNNHKKSLIFLSYAIQVLIYLILLQQSLDKFDFLKKHYNILFYLSSLFIILVLLCHFQIMNNIREFNIFVEIMLAIISSIAMYFFLYKLSIVMSFRIIKDVMISIISMYLYLSIINYYFSFRENAVVNEVEIIFYSSWGIMLLFCIIFYLFKIINPENSVFAFIIIFFLDIISIVHVELIFRDLNITFRHYSIIHICLFIDVFLLSLFILSLFLYLIFRIKRRRMRIE